MEIEQVVQVAKDCVLGLFEGIVSLRLEEVTLVEDFSGPGSWRVTLSFVRLDPDGHPTLGETPDPNPLPGKVGNREYKVVTVNDSSERVESVILKEFQ